MSPFMHSSSHNKIREHNSAQSSHRKDFSLTLLKLYGSLLPGHFKKKKSTSQRGKKDLKLSTFSIKAVAYRRQRYVLGKDLIPVLWYFLMC